MNSACYWILVKYHQLEIELVAAQDTFELNSSINAIYKFLWDYYANWFVEFLKVASTNELHFGKELYRQFLITTSPYCPFECEVLWKEFFGEKKLLANHIKNDDWTTSAFLIYFDKSNFDNPEDDSRFVEFQSVINFVEQMRSTRGLFAIDPMSAIEVYCSTPTLLKYSSFVELVAKAKLINEQSQGKYGFKSSHFEYQIDIMSYIKDLDAELVRTQKLIEALTKQIVQLESQLSNTGFVANAEPEVITDKKQSLAMRKEELEQQNSKLEFINK